MTTYKGIDYTMGGSINRDNDADIRYGVIPVNAVLSAWCEDSEANYPCDDCEAYDVENACCSQDDTECEPTAHSIENGTYTASAGTDGDIFIIKSKYYTYAQFCSPCAPGACYLLNPLDMTDDEVAHANCRVPISNPSEFLDNKCYCFGHDMFWDTETERAPYPVYSVETGELVTP